MIIAITGTPGTGKTSIAKKLAEEMEYHIIDVNQFIKQHLQLIIERDHARETNIIDEDHLVELLQKHLVEEHIEDVIIDSHLSHYLPHSLVDICIVLSCDLRILKERLRNRGYNQLKIQENLEAEAFDTILEEAEDEGHTIIHLHTEKHLNSKKIIEKIEAKQKKIR